MVLSLILLGLIVGITIRQSMQGLFSALIMTVLTVCCAAAAMGTHEWVASHWVAPVWKPDFALPVALAALFGVPLILLRLLFDRTIRRACLLPAIVERIGGGACGLLTGVTMAGMLAICIQMVPFQNGVALGFSRVDVVPPRGQEDPSATPPDGVSAERNLIGRPDHFVAGLASVLSAGVFSGSQNFYEGNPKMIQSIGWVGAAHAEVSRYAPPGSISVVGTAPIQFVYKLTPGSQKRTRGNTTVTPPVFEPMSPQAGHTFRMVRLKLKEQARDERKSHLFTLRQFRLVGRVGGRGIDEQFHPVALQQDANVDATNRYIRLVKRNNDFWPVIDDMFEPREGNQSEVEVVFELPDRFQPSFVAYKRGGARAAVSFANASDDKKPTRAAPVAPTEATGTTTGTSPPAAPTSSRRSRRRGAGRAAATPPAAGAGSSADRAASAPKARVVGITTRQGQSYFGTDMPMTLTSYRSQNADLENGKMAAGHLIAEVDQQDGGADAPITQFDVPSDKRLLHLFGQRLQARSTLGRALSQAVQVAQNYVVQDDQGNKYKFVGKYAIATVNGKQVIEVQYFRDPVGSIGGLGKFSRIDEKKLQPSDQLVLLFLVDRGARIVSFSTGGSASRRDDLTTENLVAPR